MLVVTILLNQNKAILSWNYVEYCQCLHPGAKGLEWHSILFQWKVVPGRNFLHVTKICLSQFEHKCCQETSLPLQGLVFSMSEAAALETVTYPRGKGKGKSSARSERHSDRQRVQGALQVFMVELCLTQSLKSCDHEKKYKTLEKGCWSLDWDVVFTDQHSQKMTELQNDEGKNTHQEKLTLLQEEPEAGLLGWMAASAPPVCSVANSEGLSNLGLVFTPVDFWHKVPGCECSSSGDLLCYLLPFTQRCSALQILCPSVSHHCSCPRSPCLH